MTGRAVPRWKILLYSDPEPIEMVSALILGLWGVSMMVNILRPVGPTSSILLFLGPWAPLFGVGLLAVCALQLGAVFRCRRWERLGASFLEGAWFSFSAVALALNTGIILTHAFLALLACMAWWAAWRIVRDIPGPGRKQ